MARPKNPRGNTTPRRYTGGRPPANVTVAIGKESYRTLRILALAAGRTPERQAGMLLRQAIESAWQEYDAEIQLLSAEEIA